MNANEYGVEAIGVKSLATNKLKPNPHNPRKLFDREDLKVLRESIARVKILVPLTVYREKSTGDYVILDGQRRWMCAQEVGLAAMSSSAGESGDSMLHQFRIANNLDGDRFKKLFMSRSDFVSEKLTAEDTVVLLDDFSGTGTQVCNAWTDPAVAFGELLAGAGKVYLIVVAASKAARQKITRETSISLMPAHELHEGDNVFSDKCKHFTKDDQARLLHYGILANKKLPKGFGECGFVVALQHRSPNNSIPILHANHSKWSGIFPRHD